MIGQTALHNRRLAICLLQLLGMLLTANSRANVRPLLCLLRKCQMAVGVCMRIQQYILWSWAAPLPCTFSVISCML